MRQALYRKYRPRTFDDVCGQEHITSVLRYEVAEGALSHAYLFCGSRGTGKTTCAKILAKAANCLSPVNGSPCCQCEACLSIESGAATDVLEMDAASNNGVDNIRDIRDEVVYSPTALRYRVYIVDEVHMLSPSAFNALLKTLEEPPSHVIFILATTELHKLPATIISRCQRFDFRRISLPVLSGRLLHIAKEEGLSLTDNAAEAIARAAQGGMRDAISLLELCAGVKKEIDLPTVNEMVGSGGRAELLRTVRAVLAADYDTLFSVVADAVASSRDLAVFWQELIALYRDLLILKTADNATRYLDLTDAETAELSKLAAQLGRAKLLAHCRLLEEALFAMQKANAVKRMVAELTLVRLCDPALDTSTEGLLARIETLEGKVAMGVPAPAATPAPDTAPPVENTPLKQTSSPPAAPVAAPDKAPTPPEKKPAPATAGGTRTLRRVRGLMNVVDRLNREQGGPIGSILSAAALYTDEADRIVLQTANDFALRYLGVSAHRETLARAISLELSRTVSADALILEKIDPKAPITDTVLDDIVAAAEER